MQNNFWFYITLFLIVLIVIAAFAIYLYVNKKIKSFDELLNPTFIWEAIRKRLPSWIQNMIGPN